VDITVCLVAQVVVAETYFAVTAHFGDFFAEWRASTHTFFYTDRDAAIVVCEFVAKLLDAGDLLS